MESTVLERITVNDDVYNGKPTIRGYRLTVQTVLEFILNGTPETEILHQYPFLVKEDIDACKAFALLMMNNNYSLKEFAA